MRGLVLNASLSCASGAVRCSLALCLFLYCLFLIWQRHIYPAMSWLHPAMTRKWPFTPTIHSAVTPHHPAMQQMSLPVKEVPTRPQACRNTLPPSYHKTLQRKLLYLLVCVCVCVLLRVGGGCFCPLKIRWSACKCLFLVFSSNYSKCNLEPFLQLGVPWALKVWLHF